MQSLYEYLVYYADRTPDHPCIVEVETGQTLTYAECLQALLSVRHQLGNKPQNIFLSIPGGIVSALIWLAALTGGHTLVPLSPDSVADEVRRAQRMFEPDIVLLQQRPREDSAFPATARVVTEQECASWLHGQTPQYPWWASTPTRIGSVCVMTSGSTGEPKGVVLTESQIVWTAEQISRVHGLTPQDRGLTTLPFFHINAPVVSLCASIVSGATVMIASRFSRHRFWSWVESAQPTWISLVPAIVALLLDSAPPAVVPPSLRFVRSASAPLPVAHLYEFEQMVGVPLVETYGLSEAASTVAANPLPPEPHKPGSVGRPIGIALRICRPRRSAADEELCDLPDGEQGEICVYGPGVIAAYYNNADPTAFHDGWFRTGDLGRLDHDGYLSIVGRLRSVINRGGENIAPREIEEVLLMFPAIASAAVVGRPDPLFGEVVVAYLTTHVAWTPELARQLHEHAASHLSPPKVPVDVIVLDALPTNRAGKIDLQQLRQREEAGVRDRVSLAR